MAIALTNVSKDSILAFLVEGFTKLGLTAEDGVSASRCFPRQFAANVLARKQSFRLITEFNLN